MSTAESSNSDSRICKICDLKTSKYCCPRCNVLYCSIDCYKSKAHLQCSESFYKDCVSEEMGILDPNPSSKKKMIEILSKMRLEDENFDMDPEKLVEMLGGGFGNQSELNEDDSDCGSDDNREDINEEEEKDSDDEDSVPDLADRLNEVDLEDADMVWDALTEDERKEFEALLNSGDVSKILPSWEPWWLYHKEKKLIEEIGETKLPNEDVDYRVASPLILANVKDFFSLSKQKPAACVKYNLLNVLCSYAFSVRLFNGEHRAFLSEAASCAHSICSNLSSGANFQDTDTAIESVVQECINEVLSDLKLNGISFQECGSSALKALSPNLAAFVRESSTSLLDASDLVDLRNPSIMSDAETKSTMLHDLKCLLNGPEDSNRIFYMSSALSDLHTLFTDLKKANKVSNSDINSRKTMGQFSQRFVDHDLMNLPTISKDKINASLRKIEYYLSYLKDYGSEVRFDFVF